MPYPILTTGCQFQAVSRACKANTTICRPKSNCFDLQRCRFDPYRSIHRCQVATTLHRQISSEDNLKTSIYQHVKERMNSARRRYSLRPYGLNKLKPARLVSLTISAEHCRSLLSNYRTTFLQVLFGDVSH